METPEGERRLKALGITRHVPVVVLVDGKYKHVRKDGSGVEFVSFPSGPGTPAGVKGGWSAEDVKAVVQARKNHDARVIAAHRWPHCHCRGSTGCSERAQRGYISVRSATSQRQMVINSY